MSSAREELARVLTDNEPAAAADGFAEVVEKYVKFSNKAEVYFASVLDLPTPLRELYCALIFNSNVGMDGLPVAIWRYDHPEFMSALRSGLRLLNEERLLSMIEQAREHLSSKTSTAAQSDTPNVTFDCEAPGIARAYYVQQKKLMPKISAFLKANRDSVLGAADKLSTNT